MEPAAPPRVVKIDCAESDHWTEGALPGERGQLQWQLGIGLELQSAGAGSFLILIDHQRADESDAVVAKMPAAGVAVSSESERHAAEHQKIASAVEELLNRGPCFFRKGRAVRKDQKPGGRRGQSVTKVIGVCGLSSRHDCAQLLRRGGSRVGRWKTGFAEHNCCGHAGLGQECSVADQEKQGDDGEEMRVCA